MKLPKRGVDALVYSLPLIGYGVVAVFLGMRHREMMNADAMVYIRRAGYLLHGDFYYFLSEHWSLMLSWLIAPLMAMGIDGLYAARIVNGCIGALYMVCFLALARRLLVVHWVWHLLSGIVIAPFIATVAIRGISPDLLLAVWLVLYMTIVLSPRWAESGGRQFLSGIVGGFAYLAKAFAFPFVIVHLIMTLLILAARERGQRDGNSAARGQGNLLGRVGLAYARALLGFFIVSGPWIAAISWKYGHLTFGSSGAAAHGVTGSKNLPGFKYPGEMSVFLPAGPYIAPMETPEQIFPRWSPFASRETFKYQLRVIGEHALVLRQFLSEKAPPHLLLIMMPLALLLLLLRSPQRWKLAWLLFTLALFLGPFLVVVIQHRYMNPHVVPLALLLCLVVALEWRRGARGQAALAAQSVKVSWWRVGAALLILGSFLWGGIQWLSPMARSRTPPSFRLMARTIRQQGLEGPFASDSRVRGLFIAYHSGQKYVGFPSTRNAEVAEQTMHELGVRFLMVWDGLRGFETRSCAPLIVKDEGWKEVVRFRAATVYQYTATTRPTSRPTTRPAPPVDYNPAYQGLEDDDEGEPPTARPEDKRKVRTRGGGR